MGKSYNNFITLEQFFEGSHPLLTQAYSPMVKHEVKTATMYVELLAEVFLTHRGALKMPPGKPFAPGGWPVHDVFRRSLFPKGEIHRITFLFLTVEGTGRVLEVFYVSAASRTAGANGGCAAIPEPLPS